MVSYFAFKPVNKGRFRILWSSEVPRSGASETSELREGDGPRRRKNRDRILDVARYGSLGALWSARRTLIASGAVGVAFVGEPVIAFLLAHLGIWDAELLRYTWLWASEVIAGAAAVACALTLRQPHTRRTI